MDGIRSPIGDLPPEVYWRRRFVALAIFILACVVLYYLIRGGLSGEDSTPTPDPSPSPSASPSIDLSGEASCGVADLNIDLAPTTRDFPDAIMPTFQATVTHVGLEDCVLSPRSPTTSLLITSGSDRIWSNLDCAETLMDSPSMLLSPNGTVTLTATWPRIRSNESCQVGLPHPLPGTYHALLILNGVNSDDAVFTLSD